MGDVTRILSKIESGDPSASEQLLPLIYDELRKLAANRMAGENPGQTLQGTALVHEAYIRLVEVEKAQHWDSRGHFFAAAAEAMRRILVDAARRKCTQKRGGKRQKLTLFEGDLVTGPVGDELLDLNEALIKLTALDPQASEIVKLRVFAGMTINEVAETQGISVRTVSRAWAYGRAWLVRQLDDSGDRKP